MRTVSHQGVPTTEQVVVEEFRSTKYFGSSVQ